MKIEFSEHATGQLKARPTISKDMVSETINSPEETLHSFRNRELFRKRYGDQILEVVTTQENDTIVVITEYFLEK